MWRWSLGMSSEAQPVRCQHPLMNDADLHEAFAVRNSSRRDIGGCARSFRRLKSGFRPWRPRVTPLRWLRVVASEWGSLREQNETLSAAPAARGGLGAKG